MLKIVTKRPKCTLCQTKIKWWITNTKTINNSNTMIWTSKKCIMDNKILIINSNSSKCTKTNLCNSIELMNHSNRICKWTRLCSTSPIKKREMSPSNSIWICSISNTWTSNSSKWFIKGADLYTSKILIHSQTRSLTNVDLKLKISSQLILLYLEAIKYPKMLEMIFISLLNSKWIFMISLLK